MNINQEKEKLLRNLFQAIDMLDCTESKETIAQAAIRIYDLKREILKVDPTWRVREPYNYYVHRILSLLDGVNTRENPNIQNNKELHLKLLHETKINRKIDPSWRLNVPRLVSFLKENSEPLCLSEEKLIETEETLKS